MNVDDRLLRRQAAKDANKLVVDHGAFGDAEMIRRLADLVDRAELPNAPVLRHLIVEELRARADIVAATLSRHS